MSTESDILAAEAAFEEPAPPPADFGPVVLYRDAQWVNRERTQVKVWQTDGTEFTMMANADDPRFRLIVDGDPIRGVSPIPIRDMSLEELRAQSLLAVNKWKIISLGQPISVAGRTFAADRTSREQLESLAMSAETAKKMNERFSKLYPTASGELVVMERDDVIAVWQALHLRNFGDAATGRRGIVDRAADLQNRIKQALSEDEIEALIRVIL